MLRAVLDERLAVAVSLPVPSPLQSGVHTRVAECDLRPPPVISGVPGRAAPCYTSREKRCEMGLDALTVDYSAIEDRLRLRIQFDTSSETQCWLTRRLVNLLWPALIKVAAAVPEIQVQPMAVSKKAMVDMKHDAAIQKTKFTSSVDRDDPRRTVVGSAALITEVKAWRDKNGSVCLRLCPTEGPSLDLKLTDRLLHALMQLIRNAIVTGDWQLSLAEIGHGQRDQVRGPASSLQ